MRDFHWQVIHSCVVRLTEPVVVFLGFSSSINAAVSFIVFAVTELLIQINFTKSVTKSTFELWKN